MANDRFSSQLIDEGPTRTGRLPPLGRLILAAVVLTLAGAFLVWLFMFLIASL